MQKKNSFSQKAKQLIKLKDLFQSWFIILIFLCLAILLYLNIQASLKLWFSKKVLLGLGKPESLVYLRKTDPVFFRFLTSCCLTQEAKKKVEDYYEKRKRQIAVLEQAYKKNPYDWRVIFDLYVLYEQIGEREKAEYYKQLVPKLK